MSSLVQDRAQTAAEIILFERILLTSCILSVRQFTFSLIGFPFPKSSETAMSVMKLSGMEMMPGLLKGTGAAAGSNP